MVGGGIGRMSDLRTEILSIMETTLLCDDCLGLVQNPEDAADAILALMPPLERLRDDAEQRGFERGLQQAGEIARAHAGSDYEEQIDTLTRERDEAHRQRLMRHAAWHEEQQKRVAAEARCAALTENLEYIRNYCVAEEAMEGRQTSLLWKAGHRHVIATIEAALARTKEERS
jgi:hypothetical protein